MKTIAHDGMSTVGLSRDVRRSPAYSFLTEEERFAIAYQFHWWEVMNAEMNPISGQINMSALMNAARKLDMGVLAYAAAMQKMAEIDSVQSGARWYR